MDEEVRQAPFIREMVVDGIHSAVVVGDHWHVQPMIKVVDDEFLPARQRWDRPPTEDEIEEWIYTESGPADDPDFDTFGD